VAWNIASLLVMAAALATGCATHLNMLEQGASGGGSPYLFWPPPGATSAWIAESSGAVTFGAEAEHVEDSLRDAGYRDQHWYPIGVDFAHGFAVSTRLERIDDDGTPKPTAERWSALYPDASTLKWLARASEPRLPTPGRYRAFIVTFTDLSFDARNVAPRWDEQTLMDGPALPPMTLPANRAVSARFRLVVHVYEYESNSSTGAGAFIPTDTKLSPLVHVQKAGLSTLAAAR
jgi:hypothetical protein